VTTRRAQISGEEKDRVAPGRLELVRRFVNTRDLWKGTDWIDGPDRLADRRTNRRHNSATGDTSFCRVCNLTLVVYPLDSMGL
jgi:hypothetical protein